MRVSPWSRWAKLRRYYHRNKLGMLLAVTVAWLGIVLTAHHGVVPAAANPLPEAARSANCAAVPAAPPSSASRAPALETSVIGSR